MTDLQFIPEGEDEQANVIDLHEQLVRQNTEMWQHLQALGQAPNIVGLHDIQLETLFDFLFDEDSRPQFQMACDIRLNAKLKAAIEAASGQELIVP